MRDVLERIRVPALVIAGAKESVEIVREAHELIRDSEFKKIVRDAGQFSCMENPQEFNSLVSDFLHSLS